MTRAAASAAVLLHSERKMSKADREARLQHVKALGRVAYRFLRTSEIEGVLNFDGEEKHLSKFDEDGLCMELLQPFRAGALPFD
jgi:hypothetical protein